jgi:hypothetical protein
MWYRSLEQYISKKNNTILAFEKMCSKISFVTTLVLHFDKQNKEIVIYNSNKHFHSSFTHTLLPFCFSKKSYYNVKIEDTVCPNFSQKKAVLQNYLTQHNIPFSATDTKKVLYEKIKQYQKSIIFLQFFRKHHTRVLQHLLIGRWYCF